MSRQRRTAFMTAAQKARPSVVILAGPNRAGKINRRARRAAGNAHRQRVRQRGRDRQRALGVRSGQRCHDGWTRDACAHPRARGTAACISAVRRSGHRLAAVERGDGDTQAGPSSSSSGPRDSRRHGHGGGGPVCLDGVDRPLATVVCVGARRGVDTGTRLRCRTSHRHDFTSTLTLRGSGAGAHVAALFVWMRRRCPSPHVYRLMGHADDGIVVRDGKDGAGEVSVR
jgi:hypothetical protein